MINLYFYVVEYQIAITYSRVARLRLVYYFAAIIAAGT